MYIRLKSTSFTCLIPYAGTMYILRITINTAHQYTIFYIYPLFSLLISHYFPLDHPPSTVPEPRGQGQAAADRTQGKQQGSGWRERLRCL